MCGLGVMLISLVLCLNVSVAAETTPPPLEFVDNRDSVVYRVDDLMNIGLNVGLANNTDKPLSVLVSLVDPVSDAGNRLEIGASHLVSTTVVEVPARSVTTARLGAEAGSKVEAGRYTALLVASDGQGILIRKKVTIVQRDPIWPRPTLCILFGVFISYVLTKFRTSWKPGHLIEVRRINLYEKIKDDFNGFEADHSEKPYVGFSIVKRAHELLEDVKLETKQDQLKEAETHLQKVEALFQSFRQFRADQVLGLYRGYERLKKLLKSGTETYTPHLMGQTIALLTGYEFPSDEQLKKRQSDML
ncbi:MAG: hypothetical protein WC601_05460, partial [Desulfotomaculaceae bacterium]